MHSVRTLLGIARLPTSIPSADREAQRQLASRAELRTSIYLPQPPPLRTCARGTIASLPFDSTLSRSAVDAYFDTIPSNLSRGTILSRHDLPPLSSTLSPTHDYPPSVSLTSLEDEVDLPSYSEHIGPCDDGKPFLLAQFLFKYGFC
jgi:hypothetical protein